MRICYTLFVYIAASGTPKVDKGRW